MDRTENCGNCANFIKHALASNGECHAHPPAPFPMVMQGAIQGRPQQAVMSFWPPTKDTEWCAEHVGAIVL